MVKHKTAPLFEPPETEPELSPASLPRRLLAFFFDAILVSGFFLLPTLILKPHWGPAFFLGALIYLSVEVFSYYFLGYFLMGKTVGDALAGIKLCSASLGFRKALGFSLVKTLFTIIPLNGILIFLLENNLTGEQFLFDQRYCRT